MMNLSILVPMMNSEENLKSKKVVDDFSYRALYTMAVDVYHLSP
jgi:hypothetical protein